LSTLTPWRGCYVVDRTIRSLTRIVIVHEITVTVRQVAQIND
jgi:hypothetical protein